MSNVSCGTIIVRTDGKKPCSRCGQPRDRDNQRYCRRCHREYMRDRRDGRIEMLVTPEEAAALRRLRAREGR